MYTWYRSIRMIQESLKNFFHYAVQHELENHLEEKLEQSWATVYTEYSQNRGQKKPAEKNPNREKNSAGNLGRIRGSCSEKHILWRLHGWKVFALIY